MNTQKPLKQVRDDGASLLVHSMFHTIQGEGPFAGTPSVFVRLAGCNLQCPGCDTEYSKGAIHQRLWQVNEKVFELFSNKGTLRGLHAMASRERPLVVITGGEPFRQSIWPLIREMVTEGYRVQIETNGTLFETPPSDYIKWAHHLTIVCSPKTGAIAPKLVPYINALKYVGSVESLCKLDGLPLKALSHPCSPHLARPPERYNGPVYLQPEDHKDADRNAANLRAVIDSCKKNGYFLCLQLHKIIGEE